MRIVAFIALLLFVAFQVGAQAANPTQVAWDYDYTLPNNKPCTAVLVTNCVAGFTVLTVNSSTNAIVSGPIAVFAPAVISTTGPTVGISTPFNPPTVLGNYATSITVNWKDGAGVTQAGYVVVLSYSVTPSGVLNARYQ